MMKSSSSIYQDKLHHDGKNERYCKGARLAPFLFFYLALAAIFSFFLVYSPNPLKIMPKQDPDDQKLLLIKSQNENEKCDLFKGHWVPELGEGSSQYTNSSCATIPISKNCFRHGRKDRDFLNWRWKPDECDLPRFNAKTFLGILRGKSLAFIGDSVARNHIESLLCLLSQEEVPVDAYKDSENRHRIWYFADHDFTLKMLWSRFLVVGKERMINGSSSSGVFDLYLDKVDEKWARELSSLDYVIISNAHWFFRPLYLHEGPNLIACVYCNEANVSKLDVVDAIGMAFRSAFKYINKCKKCKKMVTMLRTFSPAHFENGTWNTGGSCNRTSPYKEREIDLEGYEWKLRNIQVEEVERARKEANNKKQDHGRRFRVLDVTRAMLMRADGHPGAYWGNKWMKGYNDCVHWCLPGPIDLWSDMLMAVLINEAGLVS